MKFLDLCAKTKSIFMESTTKTKKIFIVDDDPLVCEMMQDKLSEGRRYQTLTFPTGEACLDLLKDKPDAVVLDYHLNEKVDNAMNGLEILKKIKIHDYSIPVVMLSSQESYGVAAQTISKGAIHYVIKGSNAFDEVRELLDSIFS